MRLALAALTATLAFAVAAPAMADSPDVALTIRNHRFEPVEIKVPAGQKIKLVVTNVDNTAEEFESHELNREKLIPAGKTVNIFIGPLKPGRYPFAGEFNEKTAQGVVIAE
jgi:plastocyanin